LKTDTVKSHITPQMKATLKEYASEDGVSVSTYLTKILVAKMKALGWTEPAHKIRGGYIYLIRCAGRYKIGKSVSAKQRIKNMSLPMKPEVVATAFSHDYAAWEKKLHEKFAAHRVYGEWFTLSDEQVEALKEELKQ
jgi:hypothetical protein